MTAAKTFVEDWSSTFGPPDALVYGLGGEFGGDDFEKQITPLGCASRTVFAEAHWQSGMVERHGAVWGEIMEAVIECGSPFKTTGTRTRECRLTSAGGFFCDD